MTFSSKINVGNTYTYIAQISYALCCKGHCVTEKDKHLRGMKTDSSRSCTDFVRTKSLYPT